MALVIAPQRIMRWAAVATSFGCLTFQRIRGRRSRGRCPRTHPISLTCHVVESNARNDITKLIYHQRFKTTFSAQICRIDFVLFGLNKTEKAHVYADKEKGGT